MTYSCVSNNRCCTSSFDYLTIQASVHLTSHIIRMFTFFKRDDFFCIVSNSTAIEYHLYNQWLSFTTLLQAIYFVATDKTWKHYYVAYSNTIFAEAL